MTSDVKDWRKIIFEKSPSSRIPDLAGTVIDKGRLRLVDVIGQGSWGMVYKAECTSAGISYYPYENYAVKCMAPRIMSTNQQRSVKHEIKMHDISSYSTTSSVVQFVDAVEDKDTGLIFIITELCEGGTLLDRYRDDTVAGTDEFIRQTFLQILDAVQACHKAGVYHRDLKLENIFFKANGKLVLGDFGFATYESKTTDFGLGTKEYMSPENLGGFGDQAVRSISSAQSDIWALGVLLHILVTGRMPWKKAHASDDHFMYYVSEDLDYLYKTHLISYECNLILRSVFCHPRRRITMEQLRSWISAVKSFRRGPNDELLSEEHRSLFNCDSDTDSEEPRPLYPQTQRDEAAPLRVVNGPIPDEEDVADMFIDRDLVNSFPTPPQNVQAPGAAGELVEVVPLIPITVVIPSGGGAGITEGIFVLGPHSNSSSDDAESEGLITPETHAVDNAAIAGTDATRPLEEVSKLDLSAMSTLPAPAVPAAPNETFLPPGLVHMNKWNEVALAVPADQVPLVLER